MQRANVARPVRLWRDPRHRRGLAGELAAGRYLESRGWAVEAHRFRFGHHDIDLIVRKGGLVSFVEVKARESTSFGPGSESVGWKKRAVIELVAALWVARHGSPGESYRFDVVLVRWGDGGFPQITHIEDAWRMVGK